MGSSYQYHPGGGSGGPNRSSFSKGPRKPGSGPQGPGGTGGPGNSRRGPQGPGGARTGGPGRNDFSRYARAGQDIMNDVMRAVELGQFAGLAESITRRINDAASGAEPIFRPFAERRGSASSATESPPGSGSAASSRPFQSTRSGPANYFLQRRMDKSQGRFKKFAGLMIEFFSIVLILIFIAGMAGMFAASLLIPGFVLLGLSALMVFVIKKSNDFRKSGEQYMKMVEKYYQYGEMLPGREFFAIQDLSSMVNEAPQTTQENLLEMKKLDMIPQATFDSRYTTVMLTDHARALYLNSLKAQRAREKEQAASGINPDVQAILNDGNEYIRIIRESNDRIPDTDAMSDKLYRLENIVRSIFDQVRKHPERSGELRRMMNIYLPTTTKLLKTYEEYRDNPYQTEQTKKALKEIQDAFDTICNGFEKLLAKMTEVDLYDVSADIGVLNHMMEQDGLKESEQQLKV
ncbi:MAG: 5-bromo-4-chloroindolyl phosphate hydrolysis family protein [Bilifractor sp.]|jgi:5-bromo-4-chloroindolyl phosphate hydrolysis protein